MPRMITYAPVVSLNKPYAIFSVSTKEALHIKMANYGVQTIGGSKTGSYQGCVNRDTKNIFLFEAQKLRRKVKQNPNKITRGGVKKCRVSGVEIRRGHWEVRVFKFPLDRVVDAKQLNRTFKITIAV